MEIKISAIIIARNEEKKLKGCLDSLGWVDEIVLVDNESTDKTVKIAKKYKAKVVSAKGGNFSQWRNKGAAVARGEWILYIDADERVTPALKQEVLEVLGAETKHAAYAIPRRNIILGKEMRHGGQWPDYVLRLMKKDALKKYKGELHEQPEITGSVGKLESAFIHLKHDNFSDMVEKTNKWSEIEARLMYEAGHPQMNIPRFFSAMFREFWLRMVMQAAYLDGPRGAMYALYQVFSRFVSYAKLWEMQVTRKR